MKLNVGVDLSVNSGYLLNNTLYTETGTEVLVLPEDAGLNTNLKYPFIKQSNSEIQLIRFVELRGKSEYSFNDSVAQVKGIVNKAEHAIALNDHGVGFGIFDFNQQMLSQGKKPINGVEFYVTTGTAKDKYQHLVILAKNIQGYKSLCKLLTISSKNILEQEKETDKSRPFVTLKDLAKFDAKDFVVLSGYTDSEIVADTKSGGKLFEFLSGWMDLEDFYLEVQYQDELADQVNDRVFRFAKKHNLKTVLTNDYHQINQEDSEALKVIQAIGQKKTVDKSWYIGGENRHIHTSQEVEDFDVDNSLLDNTIEILNKVETYSLEVSTNFTPIFNIPKGYKDEKDYFWALSNRGLEKRFAGQPVPQEYQDRLNYELDVIDTMGFNGYFLIVADFINYGKRNFDFYDEETVERWKDFLNRSPYQIEKPINFGPGRGSCAGSLVAYALAITEVDPLKYDLLFERFLNPERVSMPDIDTDIPDASRKEVVDYVKDFYNNSPDRADSCVAGIAIFGTYQLKKLLKALPKAYYEGSTGMNLGEKLAGLTSEDDTLQTYLSKIEVVSLRGEDKRVDKILSVAEPIVGMVSNLSQHAAGYVITPEAVTEYLPTAFVKGEQLTAYTHVEENGLLKMDFLGLKAMSIIQETLDEIADHTGETITVTKILETATKDINVFRTIKNGATKNLFQLGSDGMTKVVTDSLVDIDNDGAEEKALKEDFFSRIIAGISMYRPGPLAFIPQFIKNALNPDKIEYAVPEMKDILSSSYGLLIYQESIMSLLQVVGGFTLGGADVARRAIGKKKMDVLMSLKDVFIHGDGDKIPGGIKKSGRTVEELEELWKDIEAFAAYGFNKSHATGYAQIAIVEAWLFTYYPEYFCAADLNNVGGTQKVSERENLANMISFYKSQNIQIKPVDVNISEDKFKASKGAVYFGLNKVTQVASAAPLIARERKEHGEFTSLYNFLSRMQRNTSGINKGVISSLIVSGGLDSFIGTRLDKLNKLDEISELNKALKSNPQIIFDKVDESYFDNFIDPQYVEMNYQQLLSEEKRVTTFYISGHPTDEFVDSVKQKDEYCPIVDLKNEENIGTTKYFLGVISGVRRIFTKKNELMAFVTMEDETGSQDFVLFPSDFKIYGRMLKEGKVVKGYTEIQENSRGISAIIKSLKNATDSEIVTDIDHLQIALSNKKTEAMTQLNKILFESTKKGHTGSDKIALSYLFQGKEFFRTQTVTELTIPMDLTMFNFIKETLGVENVKLIWKLVDEEIQEKENYSFDDLVKEFEVLI